MVFNFQRGVANREINAVRGTINLPRRQRKWADKQYIKVLQIVFLAISSSFYSTGIYFCMNN